MSFTFSQEFSLGEKAPEFKLEEVTSGKFYSYSDLGSGMITVVMFICNHCPYVKHIREEIVRFANKYISEGVSFIAISSNDVENFPDDSPENMKTVAEEFNFPFPYLYDETQQVAKAYKAACTPDFYIFNEEANCVYHGRFDESNHKNGMQPTGTDLADALDQVLDGKVIPKEDQNPSSGCNIKWKSGISPF
ncbi:thioredoxin family protein [Saccharicrinis sp. FJH62]|uniref:thioredoxin family protein n=1 Tax=Saccharicrinis sp. FJH62 TaxID=3344657 RepID=UPI0035D43CB8